MIMFGKISEWLKSRRESSEKRLEKRLYEIAEETFDVSIHDNQMWFVHKGELVCPFSMFESENPSVVIESMRESYVKRSKKNG